MLNTVQDKLIEGGLLKQEKRIDAEKKSISPTVLFEALCTDTEETMDVEEHVKKYIENKTVDISSLDLWNVYHTILTTNFDKNLIDCAPKGKKTSKPKIVDEGKYLSRRMDLALSNKIFFIHGYFDIPNTICLGFDHYIKNLTKIQSFVTDNYSEEREFIYNDKRKSLSWVDFFFKSNTIIDILGLALHVDEIDLWWLLKHRAKVFKKLKNNHIRFFDLKEAQDDNVEKKQKMNEQIQAKRIVLDAMHVEVIPIEDTKKYDENYYQLCMAKIKELNGISEAIEK